MSRRPISAPVAPRRNLSAGRHPPKRTCDEPHFDGTTSYKEFFKGASVPPVHYKHIEEPLHIKPLEGIYESTYKRHISQPAPHYSPPKARPQSSSTRAMWSSFSGSGGLTDAPFFDETTQKRELPWQNPQKSSKHGDPIHVLDTSHIPFPTTVHRQAFPGWRPNPVPQRLWKPEPRQLREQPPPNTDEMTTTHQEFFELSKTSMSPEKRRETMLAAREISTKFNRGPFHTERLPGFDVSAYKRSFLPPEEMKVQQAVLHRQSVEKLPPSPVASRTMRVGSAPAARSASKTRNF